MSETVQSSPVEETIVLPTELTQALLADEPEPEKEPPKPVTAQETETTEGDTPEVSEDSPDSPETEDAVTTIKALAEKLGVKPAELYKTVVSIGDDKTATLGELKDSYQDAAKLDKSRNELDERRVAFDTEVAAKTQEMAAAVGVIGVDNLNPGQQQAVYDWMAAVKQRESALMLKTTPEWSDPLVVESDKKHMLEAFSKFGISEADMQMVTDHKWMRAIRYYALRDAKAADALKGKVLTAPKTLKPAKATNKSRDTGDRIAAKVKSGDINERDGLGGILLAG